MFRMAAFVHDLQISLVAGPDADQHFGPVVFSKVATETALSVLNMFHLVTSWDPVWEAAPIALHTQRSPAPLACKLRPLQSESVTARIDLTSKCEGDIMKTPVLWLFLAPLAFGLTAPGQNSTPAQAPAAQPQASQLKPAASTSAQPGSVTPPQGQKAKPGAGGDIGGGSGDIGKGVGKGAGKAAEGVGKGTGDLVTGHPVGAAENVGKGAGEAGKDIGVGAVKGTGKIGKGTGKLLAKPFHHHKKNKIADTSSPD